MKLKRNCLYQQKNRKPISEYTRKKLSKSSKLKIGKDHSRFSGYYITPWGKFASSITAVNDLVSKSTIRNWCCLNNNNFITLRNTSRSKYLKSLKESPIGKTYRDLGFYFIKKIIS